MFSILALLSLNYKEPVNASSKETIHSPLCRVERPQTKLGTHCALYKPVARPFLEKCNINECPVCCDILILISQLHSCNMKSGFKQLVASTRGGPMIFQSGLWEQQPTLQGWLHPPVLPDPYSYQCRQTKPQEPLGTLSC